MSFDFPEIFEPKILEIEEPNYKEIKSMKGYTYIELSNGLGVAIDTNELYNYLATIDGTSEIEHLKIGYESCLENVEIIKVFPNLKGLHVSGRNIMSLDGLEVYKGECLNIDTVTRKRNIEKISSVPIKRLFFYHEKANDFEAISHCHSLEWLEISKSPAPDFYEWRNVPLGYLKFMQGKFTELHDMAHVKTLKEIMLGDCRKFERFTGDNSNIESLTIVGCKRFDVRSIDSLQGLEYLCINDCAHEVALSDLPYLPNIRFVKLLSSKTNPDIYDLKKKMPKLEYMLISKMANEQVILLSEANADVAIEKKGKRYLNGVFVKRTY